MELREAIIRVALKKGLIQEPPEVLDIEAVLKACNLTILRPERQEFKDAVQEAILRNPKALEAFKNGKQGAINKIIGEAHALMNGRANPEEVRNAILKEMT